MVQYHTWSFNSGDNLLKNWSRASTSNSRLIGDYLPDKFHQESRNLKLKNRYPILSHTKSPLFETLNLEKVKVSGFKCIQVHSKQGNFRKKETIILYINMSLKIILSTDIYVALSRNYVCRVDPINRNFSGPAKRVRLMTCRLIGNYPAKEYHH